MATTQDMGYDQMDQIDREQREGGGGGGGPSPDPEPTGNGCGLVALFFVGFVIFLFVMCGH